MKSFVNIEIEVDGEVSILGMVGVMILFEVIVSIFVEVSFSMLGLEVSIFGEIVLSVLGGVEMLLSVEGMMLFMGVLININWYSMLLVVILFMMYVCLMVDVFVFYVGGFIVGLGVFIVLIGGLLVVCVID